MAVRAAGLAGDPSTRTAAVQGPQAEPDRQGQPCRRRAFAGSEYCYSHDSRHALERQAATAQLRARVGRGPASALERAAWFLTPAHTGGWLATNWFQLVTHSPGEAAVGHLYGQAAGPRSQHEPQISAAECRVHAKAEAKPVASDSARPLTVNRLCVSMMPDLASDGGL